MKIKQPFFVREEVIRSIRSFFEEKGFHEVITPVFNKALPLEPNIYAFSTVWKAANQEQPLFLTTSPESGLKKMIALGLGNCFSIGKCFRNLEGSGHKHNPEFLMLEWYREESDYQQIMRDTRELTIAMKKRVDKILGRKHSTELNFQGQKIQLNSEWQVFSMEKLLQEYSSIELREVIETEALVAKAKEKGYETTGSTWSQLLDQIFLNEVEPHLPTQPFFIVDFPARMSPLCKVNKKKPYLAERFEGFIAGMEIVNGNNENTDAQLVKNSFEKEHDHRLSLGQPTAPIDETFVQAVSAMSAHPYAGAGLGVDRLAMLFADTNDIKEVEYFCV
jgi:elongation factor P--beta-lysine ligase